MKILAVEDDLEIAGVLRAGLEAAGYQVQIARDGERGLSAATQVFYQAIILDRMLPGLDGLEICRELRKRQITTPILMLTARDRPQERVEGLDSGADDYLAKPFDLAELLARIRALVRRDWVHKGSVVTAGPLRIDLRAHQVHVHGQPLALTGREITLLEALVAREGQVLTKDWIQEFVWYDERSFSNVVEVHVSSLRRKIEAAGGPKVIETIKGLGYSFRPGSPA
jgi:DNA-binding response OmpR family regulator